MDGNDQEPTRDEPTDCGTPLNSDDAAKRIFDDASEILPDQRNAFLDANCRDNADLRQTVESLLKAHDEAGNFFAGPTSAAPPDDSAAGQRVGRYKLLQRIGEGGFGTVYMAEQEEPVRRRVALKIIKLGMDTKAVIARFEAERQALAMMDHPNIARVFDAGATDAGRPYFVMELVHGIPITEYCDTNKLSTRKRLELFVAVCRAVQHAHQKGIIHRDIKPSNVLVTLHDGVPVPKVIDFGIAKATSQRLTEKTLFTEFRQFIGTPEYMSPEQAEMSGLDIDTRSDIFALGVLLYELLTGTTPFDAKALRAAAYGEIQRIIREVEPPKPSTRISGLGATLAATAAHRDVDSRKLSRLMRGELDWIVMKCMEKDRTRRYETAGSLVQDIERHLADQPVEARAPSNLYRFRKLIRRNKLAFAAMGAIAVLLLTELGVSNWMYLQEKKDRTRAVAAEAKAKAEAEKSGQMVIDLGHIQWQLGDLLSTTGRRDDAKHILSNALGIFNDAAANFPDVAFFRQEQAFSHRKIGDLFKATGRIDETESHYRTASRIYASLAKDFPRTSFYLVEEAYSISILGDLVGAEGRGEEAANSYRQSVELLRAAAGMGNDIAEDRLGRAYDIGRGVAEDQTEAMKWYHLAASRGNINSQMSLGRHHENGIGVPQDAAEAVKWYRLAADQNDARAQLRLASIFTYGLGVAKNETEGLKWYHKSIEQWRIAANAGWNSDAMNELAWLLATSDVSELRDGPGAVGLATQAAAVTDGNDANIVDTLAAAYAQDGQFDKAVTTEKEAIAHLHFEPLRQEMEDRLKLYESNSPYRYREYLSIDQWSIAQRDLAGLARAEGLLRQQLMDGRAQLKPDDVELADLLAPLALTLLVEEKLADAEPLARECLEIREKKTPNHWQTFSARSILGGCLLGKKDYAGAEPLLLTGCDGMIARIDAVPATAKPRVRESIGRVVQLYEAEKHPDQAAEWKAKLTAFEKLEIDMKTATTKP